MSCRIRANWLKPLQRLLARSLCLCLLLLAGNASAQTSLTESFKNVQSTQLANGLQLVVIPDHRAKVVSHVLAYRVGSKDDPKGKSGIAHYLEHLLFKGTKKFPRGTYSETLEGWGGEYNAFTSHGITAYFAAVPKTHLPALMAMEADRMKNIIITEEMAATERSVVLEERLGRVDNNPQGQFYEALFAKAFANSPFAAPVIGHRKEIETYTADDALRAYRQYYAPNNAVLAIGGDIDFASAVRLAKRYYARLAPVRLPPPLPPTPPLQQASEPIRLTHKFIEQPFWQRIYRLPVWHRDKRREFLAWEALAFILGGDENAQLYKSYVIEKQEFAMVFAHTNRDIADLPLFDIGAAPLRGQSPKQIGALIKKEITSLAQTPISATRLQGVKNALLASAMFEQDDQLQLALTYAALLAHGRSVQDFRNWVEGVQTLTTAEIQQAAQSLLTTPFVDGIMEPAG